MNEKVYDEKAERLFPTPSPPPTVLCPQRWPGFNFKSLTAVPHVLIDNYTRYHIFRNYIKFHNGPVMEGFYKRDIKIQRDAFVSPHPITSQNFVDHLGDENYYEAYTTSFAKAIEEKAASATLDEFIFSEKYNFQPGRDAKSHPEVLCRFVDAVMHPLIHCGHGVEFGLKGTLAEGLSMAAIHEVRYPDFLPSSMFVARPSDDIGAMMNNFASSVLDDQSSAMPLKAPSGQDTHSFSILARVLKDPSLAIRDHVQKWTVDSSRPGEIERKMEECIGTSSVIYALGGWRNGFPADFFLMHMVTSSIFLPSLIVYLSPRAQALLLRAYLLSVVAWFVARGRPPLNFKSFFESTPTIPNPPNSLATSNSFLPLVQSSMMHPSEHHPKIQRAFAYFSTIYGIRPKGYFAETELDGAEELDGSLFVRAAVLNADYMGWTREGEEARNWSYEGFYV
ncbi:uncharacterized protein HD556DRAFT_1479300 [Suillus plorans]|uniref:Uncharacterized protein n=1 Tax=Suillus plorans TaxID=116603 RepID=A0A9P7DHE0_9AGAM|nr:uncharacterized protein HD556DRAFT_1479300 [Suillus plorans]KAG1793541.1 hypothetical protein HD556DRAFT_1479300 [Suillus plorans]